MASDQNDKSGRNQKVNGKGQMHDDGLHVQGASSCSSSAHNSDDEESGEDSKSVVSYKDRRREAHTFAEQKRRDAIKRGYDELQSMVPLCQQPESFGNTKLSKATVLQRSIEYIQFLIQQKKKQDEELDALRKEVMALKIMKTNYEHLVRTHQNMPAQGDHQLPDTVKLSLFHHIVDSLFVTFNDAILVSNFNEMSLCIINWLEEHCKPQTLQEVLHSSLRQVATEHRRPGQRH